MVAKSYLIDAIPVEKTAHLEPLSYFSSEKIPTGTLIKVPVRHKSVPALVLRSRDAKSAKSEIRKAGFLLKKIKKSDISEAVIPKETLGALEKTAEYYSTTLGALLSALLPKMFLDEPAFLKFSKSKKKLEEHKETILLQMESDERFGQYRALVRQAFARGSSVLFITPTHLDSARARSELSRGIEEFVYTYKTTGKKSEIKKLWKEALEEKHPILFITTSSGIFLPRHDIDTLILDRENSRSYRALFRPFISQKFFIEHLAKENNYYFAIGDSVLSLETLWREKNGEFGESSLIRWRLPGAATTLAETLKGQNENGRFEIITQELKALIEKALNEDGKIFLYGARKGLSPTTVCGDCGKVLECQNCSAPMVLHEGSYGTIYICHACGARRESTVVCAYCGSWKLVPLGIGVEQIARAMKDLYPRQNVYILDKDHVTTDASAKSIAEKFEKVGGILVGTEMAFFHLNKVPYSGLVSADALFSIPDFSINERIFYLVSRLREMTEKECVIQSRNIGRMILSWASTGNIIDFYQSEIKEREELLYPPFSIFIKITLPKKDALRLAELKERFREYNPSSLRDSLVMRIERKDWPFVELARSLALLPPQYSIKVDADSIL